MAENKPTIGLTGGIASGKSVVGRALSAMGVGVVDADQLARDVVEPGSEGLAEVVECFGMEVLAADGSLDREKLGSIVFGDEQLRKKLQAITHPRIGILSGQRMAALQETDTPYVVYEAPLLVELGAHKRMAALVVVAASEPIQVARVMTRDSLSAEAAGSRISAQLPLEQKVAVADYVIHNEGSLDELQQRTVEVHKAILERFEL